jgi:Zn-dependent protease/CBS domain-containing protein
MKWAIRLGRVAGTEVRVHVTFLILLAGLGIYFWLQAGPAAAVDGVLFVLAVFACVLLHEFGHVLMARRFGIRTPDITLLPIGGLARLEKMPEKPWQELLVALAGPAVNVVIVLILLPLVGLPTGVESVEDISFSQRLLLVNGVLVVFNMIPAFPMDGGRVLRALLAMIMDYTVATRVAAAVGQGFAVVGGILGLVWMHPLLLLVSVFVFMAAKGEAEATTMRSLLRGVPLRRAMMTDFRTLRREDLLGDAARELLAGPQHDFPVVEEDGRLIGLLTRSRLIEALAEHGRGWPVEQAMRTEVPTVPEGFPLREAYAVLSRSPIESLPVMENGGARVVGLLTAENVGELLLIRSAEGGKTG